MKLRKYLKKLLSLTMVATLFSVCIPMTSHAFVSSGSKKPITNSANWYTSLSAKATSMGVGTVGNDAYKNGYYACASFVYDLMDAANINYMSGITSDNYARVIQHENYMKNNSKWNYVGEYKGDTINSYLDKLTAGSVMVHSTTSGGTGIHIAVLGKNGVWSASGGGQAGTTNYGRYRYMTFDSYFKYNATDASTSSKVGEYIRIYEYESTGNMALKKVSSCPSVSAGNQFYSLAGATYGLYTSAWDSLDDSNRKGTFTTNASGTSNTITGLDPGTYYVKELTAPEGFKIDSTTHTVIVSAGQTNTFTVYEDPITDPVSLFLSKKDPYLGYTPQGDTSLEGAVFQFDFYADYLTAADIKTGSYSPIISFKAETKLIENVATGEIETKVNLAQEYGCIIESSFSSTTGATLAGLYDEDGDLALPMGSLAVYEVDAPEGYTTDGYTMEEYDIDGNPITGSFTTDGIVVMQIDPEGNHTSSIQVHNQILVTETGMFRTGFNGMKLDSETASQFPQGDASLAGAVINVENASENAIVILGDTDDDYEIFEPGETIFQLETIEDGTFASDMEALPLGTYILTEDSAPEGYLMNEDWSRTFTIREGDDPVSISLTDTPLADQVIRGGVSIVKYDKELGQSSAIGLDEAGTIKPDSPTLIGIAFDIKNVGENRVLVEGVSYEPGEVVKTIYSYYDEASKSYIAKTESDLLPYGNYEIQEVQTVDGYLLTDTTPRKFFIENEGEIVTHDTSGTEMIFSNQVIRGDFNFMKIEGDTSSRMQTLWTVENTTTGEIHTLATDKNGEFYSSADDGFAHTKDTNANDFLLDRIANGETISISEVNQSAGLWFGLSDNGSVAKVDDSLGALPYGLYTLSEVRTDTNEGLDLKTLQFYIYRDGRSVDLGTLTNVIRDIVTDAYDGETGLQYGSRREDAILIDKVTYKGFDRNTEYTVVGNLVDTTTGGFILDHMGDVLEVTHKFTTTSGDGYENIEFVFDSRQVNEAVVVFQTVYDSYGNKISEHRDIDEARQTVVYPRLETYASADSTGSNIVNADGTVTFTDRVVYEGLTRGDKYTLKAVLMNRELGDELLDKDGNEVTAELEFIAEQADGEVEISVTFDITGLEGTEAVFFETLYDIEGVIIGEHKDIDDENQIVNVPSVSTQATYLATSSNMGGLSTHAIIDDEAAYKAVALDMNYKMSGILMDKATGEVYKTTSGEEVTSELEFTPVEKEGSVVLRFELDSMLLGGQDLVVFETLYAEIEGEYVEVASHRDIDDVNQTISFPGVTTEAYTKSTGTHMSKIQEYVLSEEPTEDEDLDVEENEDLDTEENEDELDSEEDNSNEEESIMTVESDAPDDLPSGLEEDKEYLDSLLPNEDSELEEDTDVEEEEEQGPVYVPVENLTDVFYDTVTYNGLTPGLEYTVKGSLIDKATGTMAFADGLAEMVFTPEEADGELIMEFPEVLIKDILGMHVVVFEEIYLGDDLIASHTDIDSTTQSIYILEIDTKATGSNLTAKTVELGTKVKVVDTITHPYIDVDQTYRVESQLIRKSTGDVISEVTTSYTPTASNGSVGITFTVDTSDYLNEELVAFQTIYDENDNIVGEHKDIDDADQTVLVTDKIVVQTGLSGNIALMLSLISLILASLGGYALHIKKMRKSLK